MIDESIWWRGCFATLCVGNRRRPLQWRCVCSTLYGSPPEGGREGKGKERKEGACTAARSARAEGGVIEEDKWNILGVRVTSAYVCRTESARSGARIAGAAIDARDGAFGEKEKESANRVGCC